MIVKTHTLLKTELSELEQPFPSQTNINSLFGNRLPKGDGGRLAPGTISVS